MSDTTDLELQIDALETLVTSPGWKMVQEHLKKDQQACFSAMQGAKSNDELLRFTYAYMAKLVLPDVPVMLLSVLQNQLTKKQTKK